MIDTDYHSIQKKSPIQGQVLGDACHADLDPCMLTSLGTAEFRSRGCRFRSYLLAEFIGGNLLFADRRWFHFLGRQTMEIETAEKFAVTRTDTEREVE